MLTFLLVGVTPLRAQDTPTPPPTAAPQTGQAAPDPQTLYNLVATAAKNLEQAEAAQREAYSFFGLFDEISLVLTLLGILIAVIAVVGGIFGLRNYNAVMSRLALAEQKLQEREQELLAKQADMDQQMGSLLDRWQKAGLALALLPLAERQYRSGNLKGALDVYRRAWQKDADNPITHYYLGYVYTQQDKLEEAEHHLTHALEIDPELREAKAALGLVRRRKGEKLAEDDERRADLFQEAEGHIRAALRESPNLVDGDGESWRGSLGGLYRRSNRLEEAIRAYEMAEQVTPYSSYPTINLALLYMQMGKPQLMLAKYRQTEMLAEREAEAELNNYWGYADLLTARLALGRDEEIIQKALDWLFKIMPPEAYDALPRLLDTLRKLAALFDEKSEDLLREIPADQLERRVARIEQTIQAIESYIAAHKQP
jgi:tetratricopeptide (TPR) repeat protein